MRHTEPTTEGCKATDEMHNLRLTALLQELLKENGKMATAQILGVNYKTLARSMQRGRLSQKMHCALERMLPNGEGCAAPGQLARNAGLEKQLDALEEELRRSLEEFRTALDGCLTEFRAALDGQRREHASHRSRMERQLAALVLGDTATAPETPASDETGADESGRTGTSNGPPWWRPGEAAEREVADLIYEWRRARIWFIAAEERLGIALDWDMVADLAVRDDSADAFGGCRTPRTPLRSKRNLARSEMDTGTQTS